MTDRPIIFSAPMVQALLAGRKSMTRRVLRPQPPEWVTRMTHEGRCGWIGSGDGHGTLMHVPYAPGDRLWCREAFRGDQGYDAYRPSEWSHWPVHYEADGYGGMDNGRLRSPIHMPRWASRLTLTVTDVRVQRLHDISAADAIAEGCHVYASSATIDCDTPDPRQEYRRLWNSIHGPEAWAANPWVAALTFATHRHNIDQMEPTND